MGTDPNGTFLKNDTIGVCPQWYHFACLSARQEHEH